MKIKKVPLRTCGVSNEKCPKSELLRVVKNNDGDVFVDLTGKANGRGAYIKKDLDILKKARISKKIDRHLEIEVPNEVYDELESIISK